MKSRCSFFLIWFLFFVNFIATASIPSGELFPGTGLRKNLGQKAWLILKEIPENVIPADELFFNDFGGKNKKWIALLLAFPLPLGILGAHRIYLGTNPIVPVVYIVTIGGAAGILPLIDFMVLLLAEDITRFENNPNIIMWMKE